MKIQHVNMLCFSNNEGKVNVKIKMENIKINSAQIQIMSL